MNKYTKQLNRILAVITLAIIIMISGLNTANARIFDWFSGTENDTFGNSSFGSFVSFLNSNDQVLADNQSNEGSLPVIQGSSLISVNLPIIPQKLTKPVQENTANQTIKELIVSATAYSSTPDQTDNTPFITALGTTVRDGIIAANFLPFGTKVKIPDIYGNKIFVVEDRMNRRYWHTIDIWFPDRASALEFGFKKIKIQILDS